MVLEDSEIATFQGGMLVALGVELVCSVLLKTLGVAAFKIHQGKNVCAPSSVFLTLGSIIPSERSKLYWSCLD